MTAISSKGLPYLDGFRGVFMLQAAAMLNALQGGQVLGEFRGISPAERDRLTQAMGDKVRIEESSWTLNLLIAFNVEKKPFDDVRVRKALLMAIDRWGGSQGLSKISTLRSVGGVIRPGSPYATPEAELVKLPGFSKDINASRAEAKRLLAEAGVPNLKFTLHNRNLAMPYTPAGIFLVDQWRQIGVTAEHKQFDTAPYLATMNAGNHDVAIDFSNLFMDEPSLGLAKYVSFKRAPENRSRANDDELDKLYDAQVRELDANKRKELIKAFEKRLFDQAYQQPILWWHRIVPTHKVVMGWKMSPSHNLGQIWPRSGSINESVAAAGATPGRGLPDDSLYHPPHVADDPHADRRGGACLLHVAHRAGRRGRSEAARRRRQCLARDDRHGTQAARPRQAAAEPVRGLDDRARNPQPRHVDVDRPAGNGRDRRPPPTFAAGRDHGNDHRRLDRHSARNDGRPHA